jgi:hypothetical protein
LSRTDEVVAKVHDLVRADQRLIIREVAEEQGISSGSCKGILTKDLVMRHVSAKYVPWLLTAKQEQHLSVSSDFLKRAGGDKNFLKNIVTGDETWVCSYDPETKQLSLQWITSSSPWPKKACQV